jgi:hypothetical protein
MFFGKDSRINVISPDYVSKNDPQPIAYKGDWNNDTISGNGFLKFSSGLCIYG